MGRPVPRVQRTHGPASLRPDKEETPFCKNSGPVSTRMRIEVYAMIHKRITIDPKVMFGKPVIKGKRVPVEVILRKVGAGMTDEQIMTHHPHLSVEDIQAAAAFAADHLSKHEILLAPAGQW